MYRFAITIDRTKVQGTNTNFPYLFSEGCASIPTGFWSHVTDTSTGLDIRFFDTDGGTELKREVVLYSSGTSKVEIWVQIPSLGTASNKVIHCQYGGPTRTSDTAVWTDAGYKAVYHLQANAKDAAYGNTGTVNSATVNTSGKIESAYDFSGSSQSISAPSTANILAGNETYVMSAWAYLPNSNQNGAVFGKRSGTGDYPQVDLAVSGPNSHLIGTGKRIAFLFRSSDYSEIGAYTNSDYATGAWRYLVGVADKASSSVKIYVDGSPVAITTDWSTGLWPNPGNADNLTIGNTGSLYLNATIDEARISKTAPGDDWVKTEYNNQNAPSTFSTCGAEDTLPKAKFQIKIDKTKIQGSHTNFPYLFSELSANIPSGFWRDVVNTSGLDIRFYDTDKSTELKREIVLFDPLNRKLEIWVQIPLLYSTSDKYVWCTYGGSTRSSDSSVWTDIGCKSCVHFQKLMNDSAEGYTATITGATQISNGKIQKAYSFISTNGDHASIARSTAAVSKTAYTVSAWAYCTGDNGFEEQSITSDITSYNYYLNLTGSRQLSGKPGWQLNGYDGAAWRGVASDQTSSTQYNAWHHVVGTYDGDKLRIYVDGQLKNTSAHYVLSGTSTNTIYIGVFLNNFEYFNGYIEELRHYNVVKSGDWIATEFNNQNDPASFSRCSSETSMGGKIVTTIG